MKLYYDKIEFGNDLLMAEGEIDLRYREITLLRGKSGSGKSSLLKNIMSNEKNSIYKIVIVDQDNEFVLNEKTVTENISMSRDEKHNTYVSQIVSDLGFSDLLEKKVCELSGGAKRIVNILRGLLSEEDIVFIDEPTNDLDNEMVNKIKCIFRQWKNKKTILLVSHDDRLREIADVHYEINQNKEVVTRSLLEQKQEVIKDKNIYKDFDFLKSIFKYNVVTLLFMVLISYVASSYIVDFAEKDSVFVQDIKENQLNIYVPISASVSAETLASVFPTKSAELMFEKNPFSILAKYREIQESYEEVNYTFINDLCDGEKYIVYPIEYYDPATKESFFVLDYYLKKYHNTTHDVATIDTSSYYEQPYDFSYEKRENFQLSIEKYNECVNELKQFQTKSGAKLELVCAVLVFKEGFCFEEFLTDSAYENINNKGLYVKCNELNECMKNAKKIDNIYSNMGKLLVFSIFVMILDFVYWILYMNIQKNKILLIKNYGYSKRSLEEVFSKKVYCRYPKVIVVLILMIFNVYYLRNCYAAQLNYYYLVYVMVYASLSYNMTKWLVNYMINKFYRWDTK